MQGQKPEFTSSTALVKANEVLPATLLAKLLSENKVAFGMAIKNGDKIEVEKFPHLEAKDLILNETGLLNNIMANTKKYACMFSFHDIQSKEFDEDEVQPWTLIRDSKGNAVLTVTCEGDFPNFAGDAEGFSEPYCLIHNWLGPKVEGMYKTLGNNPRKLYEYLRTEQFINDFKLVVGHRGVLSFVTTAGDSFTIAKNDLGLEASWGEVSNSYGYTEPVIAAATPAEPTPAATKRSKYADPPAATATPKAATAPTPAPVKDPVAKVADDLTKMIEIEVEEVWTPPETHHGKALKELYRKMDPNRPANKPESEGHLPEDWKSRPSLIIKVKKKVLATSEEGKAWIAQHAKAAVPEPKDMKAPTPAPATTGMDRMPVISGELQAKSVAMIKKYLGDGAALIDDPTKAQAEEDTIAKFSELHLPSKNIRDILRWPTSFVFAYIKENPEAGAQLVVELRGLLRRFADVEKHGEKKLAELVGQWMPSASDKQVEVPPAQPGTTPAVVPAAPVAPAAPVETRKRSKYV